MPSHHWHNTHISVLYIAFIWGGSIRENSILLCQISKGFLSKCVPCPLMDVIRSDLWYHCSYFESLLPSLLKYSHGDIFFWNKIALSPGSSPGFFFLLELRAPLILYWILSPKLQWYPVTPGVFFHPKTIQTCHWKMVSKPPVTKNIQW